MYKYLYLYFVCETKIAWGCKKGTGLKSMARGEESRMHVLDKPLSPKTGLVFYIIELGNITILPYIVILAFDIVFNLQYCDIVFK